MNSFEQLHALEVTVPEAIGVQVRSTVGSNPEEIGPAMGAAMGTLMGYIGQHGLQCVGAPRCVYLEYGPDGTTFLTAMPVAAPPLDAGTGPVSVGPLPSGEAFRFTHTGPYPQIGATYHLITDYMRGKGLMESEADWMKYMPMWEEYLNDPATTPEAELVTHIYLPIAR
ncbi:MAG: GyrI-like domain-containing protein [Ignavibacteriae bacterium]|nr:GyrI-like domain-containing protein [Ignavibacteriota bacterium]